MASAVDSRLAYARLSAVATASRLPTATRGSNNSYTTSWDTTHLTETRDWSTSNRTISLLRSAYRRPCVDLEGLRNPVDLWLAGGGKFHPLRRC